MRATLDKRLTVQRFIVDRIPVFLDPFGNVIDVEVGQADGGVLMAQNSSLIYYITSVNDVYAYFLTGTKNGGITPKPTHLPHRRLWRRTWPKVTTFATAHGKTFPDPDALAIEVKTAWIDASGIPNPTDYITIRGTVPTYATRRTRITGWRPGRRRCSWPWSACTSSAYEGTSGNDLGDLRTHRQCAECRLQLLQR